MMRIRTQRRLWLTISFIMIMFASGCDNTNSLDHLYTPTMITKIEDTYYIEDCWYHRILYNDSVEPPISKWKVLTDDIWGAIQLRVMVKS